MAAKKNEQHPLRIEGYGSAGEGVARLEGQAVFVKGALAGEICQVQLLKVGKSAAWGRVTQVLTPVPGRQSPDCPRYPRCGGCQLRHMTYAEELRFKRQKVQDALQRIGGWTGRVEKIHGAEAPDRYRNKIQFPVADGPRVGFFRARSHEVIDAEDCLLQPLAATRLREAFKLWMERYQVPAYDERVHGGLIRHFYVRVNQRGQSLCAVIANGTDLPHQEELVQALRRAEPDLAGVVLSVNQEKTNVILGKTHRCLWGRDYLEDTLCGLTFRLSVPSFYQVNREQAEVLYGRALAFAGLTGRETVLDLYCGIGTITLVMARQAGRAIGAEVIPAAVEDAKANAARNGVTNAEFLCADAAQAAQTLADRGLRKKADSYIHIDVEFGEGEGKIPVDSIAKRAEAYKPKEKVTYKMIKEYIEAKYGFKVHTAYIAEVKRDLGLPMYDAPNAVEELKQPKKHPTPEKVEAIKDALRYFAVI
ncbi:MAG: 23S rRNA (uracil(1939)-C(5))-methyltransferase RlmD [Evtepia gabavorous]